MTPLFASGYYHSDELRAAGIGAAGENVRLHRTLNVYRLDNLFLGDNVVIDAYVSLIASGPIRIGSNVHIGSYCQLSGGEGIVMEDFSGLSQGVRLYSRSDDYSGHSLTNPTTPPDLKTLKRGTVTLERHVIIGANSVILPAVTIGEGSAVGALSLVDRSLPPWGIFAGTPVRKIKDRSRRLLDLEAEFLERGG